MKKLLDLILFLIVAVTVAAQSQTSFVVTDKNGNSQLVQSLKFGQVQYGDRTSSGTRFVWIAEENATGNIEDLKFIARSNNTLATGSVDDVTTMLEQISGSKNADAETVATILTNNENIDEASSSSDGQSLIVKYKNEDVYSVYPINPLKDPFEEEETNATRSTSNPNALSRNVSSKFNTTGSRGKVAVFNYFSNDNWSRNTQNKMLEYMMYDLNDHGYGVEYYPYEEMTVANVKHVISVSSIYTAVIVISHGFSNDKHSYFAIGEAYDRCNYDADVKLFIEDEASENNKVPFRARFWNEGFGIFGSGARYDCAVNVNKLSLDNNVVLYMGACDAYNNDNKMHGTCVGWSGSNATAQAHVALLFYNLMRGKTLADAIDVKNEEDLYYYSITHGQPDTWRTDPLTNAQMKYKFQGMFKFNAFSDPHLFTPVNQYFRQGRCYLVTVPSGYNGPFFTSEKKVKIKFYMRNNFGTEASCPKKIYIKVTPLRSDESSKTHVLDLINVSGTYEEAEVKLSSNGVYVITAATDEAFSKEILLRKPLIFVKAKPFKENSGEGEVFYATCPDNNHPHAIDLGLPSGRLWACSNVGAKKPEECGNYYAWGDTNAAVEREIHNVFDDYVHCDGSYNTCHDLGASICGTQYDVAHVNWGGNWRMPTQEEYQELRDNCSLIWDDSNGKHGLQIIGPNNNSIFLPAGGEDFVAVGEYGRYWTGIQHEEDKGSAYQFEFFRPYGAFSHKSDLRGTGHNVRPILSDGRKTAPAEAIDLGLPSGTKWASCNVGATKPEEFGGYYAWGETWGKNDYSPSTYKYCDGTEDSCYNLGESICGTDYDVAYMLWGEDWQMPSHSQFEELIDNCTQETTTLNGIKGVRFTGPNGNSIFIPAAGERFGTESDGQNDYGDYLTGTQYPSNFSVAYGFYFGYNGWGYEKRWNGHSVRPVKKIGAGTTTDSGAGEV